MPRGINKAIIDLYRSGKSIPQIAAATGIPRSTIRYHVKKAGVLMRIHRAEDNHKRNRDSEGRFSNG